MRSEDTGKGVCQCHGVESEAEGTRAVRLGVVDAVYPPAARGLG